jgi:hypothetical protein
VRPDRLTGSAWFAGPAMEGSKASGASVAGGPASLSIALQGWSGRARIVNHSEAVESVTTLSIWL